MKTLTIYFCGTTNTKEEGNTNRVELYTAEAGYIPAKLAQEHVFEQVWLGQEEPQHTILDGPGTHPTGSGVRDVVIRFVNALVAQDMQHIASLATKFVAGKRVQTAEPMRINIVAHSRGAVIAIMVARECSKLEGVEFNIFAIDPVPGMGMLTEDMACLERNVTCYCGVYAMDETSPGFNALIPNVRAPSVTRRDLFRSRGRHGTVAGNASRDGVDGEHSMGAKAVSLLVYLLARRFLIACGTPLTPQPISPEMFERWRLSILRDKDVFDKMRSYTYLPQVPGYRAEKAVTSTPGRDPRAWQYASESQELASAPWLHELGPARFGVTTEFVLRSAAL